MYKEEPRYFHKYKAVDLNISEWGSEEIQQSQSRNIKELIREMIKSLNNDDIEKAAEILGKNLDNANKILQDSDLQHALIKYYKPSEEFCILPDKDDYSVKTLTIKVMIDMILRDQVNLTIYSDKEIAKLKNFIEFFTWGSKDNGELYLIVNEDKLRNIYNYNDDQIIKFKNEFLKLSEPFVNLVNLVKREKDHILSNLPESGDEDNPYKVDEISPETFTIPYLCLQFLQIYSKDNELKPLYDSYKGMVNFVKGMKDLLINHRSMLKAKYLYNPNNKEEFLYDADEILDTCLMILKRYPPEDIIDRLDTIFCYSSDNLSGLYCMKDPETALGRMLTLYDRFYDKYEYSKLSSSFMYHSNNSYIRDDYYSQREFSQHFWNKSEIKDAINEAWPELAGSLDKSISTGELREIIARAIIINENCGTPDWLSSYDIDVIIKIFSTCKENSQRFNFSYEDLLNDTYADTKPYYEGQGEEFEKLFNLVQNCAGKRIAICTHEQPDHDAYGSQIALGLLMEKFGATVFLYNPSANQEISHAQTLKSFGLLDLDGNDLVKISSSIPKGEYFDQVILLDCDKQRVKHVMPRDYETYFRFDHHEGANFVEALATCEFIGYLYERLNQDDNFNEIDNFNSNILLDQSLKIESLIPAILYTGCYMDTSSFHRSSKNLTRLIERLERENGFLSKEVVSSLVEYACPDSYRCKFTNYMITNNRVIKLKNGLGLIVFNEMDSFRFPETSLGVITNKRVGLPDDYVRIFPPKNSKGKYSISLRSSYGEYKAVDVAQVFGGGGHQGAAGCSISPKDLLNPEYVRDIVKGLTGWTDDEYNESDLAYNLEQLRSEDDNVVRMTLKAIALSREDYEEALKLSCPSFSLLDVGGIYTDKYVASLALILEEIPGVYKKEDDDYDYYDYD